MRSERLYREFNFGQQRPGDAAIRDTIRVALEDEGLRLGVPGASAHLRYVIDRAGNLLVRVPLTMIDQPPLSEAELYMGLRGTKGDDDDVEGQT